MSDTPAGGSAQQFTWDTSDTVPQLLEDGTNYYLYGPNIGSAPIEQISISGSTTTYLVSDTTGVREQIESSGSALSGSMSYDTYGDKCGTCSISTPFGFEGGYTDATGLVYLIGRYYDSATEQFLSLDPLVGVSGQPYAFTGGDPVNGSDPSGLGFLQAVIGCLALSNPVGSVKNLFCDVGGFLLPGPDIVKAGYVAVSVSATAYEQNRETYRVTTTGKSPQSSGLGWEYLPDSEKSCPVNPRRVRIYPSYNVFLRRR
jgi:RHS repeat-associated protein